MMHACNPSLERQRHKDHHEFEAIQGSSEQILFKKNKNKTKYWCWGCDRSQGESLPNMGKALGSI